MSKVPEKIVEMCEWLPIEDDGGRLYCANECGLPFEAHTKDWKLLEIQRKVNEIISYLEQRDSMKGEK